MKHRNLRGSERGVAVFGVTVSAMVVAGALVASMAVQQGQSARTLAKAHRDRAFVIAESGVDSVQVLLNAEAWGPGSTVDWRGDGSDNDGDGRVDEGDESLVATAQLWGSDDADNDGDGRVDEPDERVARVACSATIGRSAANLTAWLRSDMSLVPEPPGTVYLADPLAQFSFNGNSLTVDGSDQNLDGTAGPDKPIYAVATSGPTTNVLKQLLKIQMDNLTGAGGSPSITSWEADDPNLIDLMIQAFGPRATIVLPGSGSTYTMNLGDASKGDFQITLGQGSVKLGGGSHGAGILLVDGDLEISGGWDYTGLVVVAGRFSMKGGGSTIRLRGAAFVGGDMVQPTAVLSGNIFLQYSSEALSLVQNQFGVYTVSAIVEG